MVAAAPYDLFTVIDSATLDAIGRRLGWKVRSAHRLSGGCIATVLRVDALDNGARRDVVVKYGGDDDDETLAAEGRMLGDLRAAGLPVPRVELAEPGLLVLEHIEHDGRGGESAEQHAAELLAGLHSNTSDRFGYTFPTPLGGIPQPNDWSTTWPAFYGRRRLIPMAAGAVAAGRLGAGVLERILRLAERLPGTLGDCGPPSLIHGDIWGGNVLCHAGRIAAFIAPAISYADAELELAFITLFGTFGRSFFQRYEVLRTIRPGFFEWRRDLYNIYPLLVHARLFGGGYGADVESTLRRVESTIGAG